MTELETIQRAQMYMDKLAKGINPIENTPVLESGKNEKVHHQIFDIKATTVMATLVS